jgi:hypothetical protein
MLAIELKIQHQKTPMLSQLNTEQRAEIDDKNKIPSAMLFSN